MENIAKQAEILIALHNRVAGFTKQRGGTSGYSLKVNNMARKAAQELEAAGTQADAAKKMAFETLAKAQVIK